MHNLNLSDIKQMALNDQENSIGLSPSMSLLCTLSCINFAQLQDEVFFLAFTSLFLKSNLESFGRGDVVRLIVRNSVSHEEDEKNIAQRCYI